MKHLAAPAAFSQMPRTVFVRGTGGGSPINLAPSSAQGANVP